MKKSLIALAVAGLVSAPAFAATSNVDVYGVVYMGVQDLNTGDLDVRNHNSRIGFKGSEDLGGGLKAVWQIEQQLDATGTDNSAMGGNNLRNTFIGLAGNFGTFVMGRHDTPYKIATGKYDIFADTLADYNGGNIGVGPVNATHDARATNALAYISPAMSGVTVAAAVVASDDALTIAPAGGTLNTGETFDAYSLAVMYANGPMTVDFGYQNVRNYSQAWKIGAGYKFGDLGLGFVYEDSNKAQDQKGWLLNATYAMGPMTFKAQYGERDAATDMDRYALGLDYSLSKRTSAHVIYGDSDANVDGWSVGVRHAF